MKDYKNTFVALLDILGFSSMVKTVSNKKLKSIFKQLTDIVSTELLWDFEEEKPSKKQDLNYLIISDSIIIWSDRPNLYSFYSIVRLINTIIINSIKIGIPLRGALVYGPLMLFDNRADTSSINHESSLIGKAIIDAYTLGNELEMVGCVIEDNCFKFYRKLYDQEKGKKRPLRHLHMHEQSFLQNSFIKTYVPYKSKEVIGYLCHWINDLTQFRDVTTEVIEKAFLKNKSFKGESAVKIKMMNTMEYIFDYLDTNPFAQILMNSQSDKKTESSGSNN